MALTDSYDAIYERALQLVSESRWDEALAEYRRMFLRLSRLSPATLDSHPDLKELLSHAAFDMTQLLAELGRYDEAMDILRRLVDILPEHKSLWLREAARFRIQLGEAEQALAELQVLAQQEPGQPYNEIGLGEAYLELDDCDTAVAHFERAIELASDPEASAAGYHGLIDAYMANGQPDQVLRAWDLAVALDPTTADSVSDIYDHYLGLFQPGMARPFIERERNLLKRGLYAGIADQMAGDPQAAARQWRRVLRQNVTADTAELASWIESGLYLGESRRVLEKVVPFLEQGSLNLYAMLLLGIAWAMEGDVEMADTFLEAIRSDPVFAAEGGKLPLRYASALEGFVSDESVKAALRHHFEEGDDDFEGMDGAEG